MWQNDQWKRGLGYMELLVLHIILHAWYIWFSFFLFFFAKSVMLIFYNEKFRKIEAKKKKEKKKIIHKPTE